MTPALIVARREYRQIASTRGFLLTLLIVPLIIGLSLAITAFNRPQVGEAYLVIDRAGGYETALDRQIERDYQRGALSALIAYQQKRSVRSGGWLSDQAVDAFIQRGGIEAALDDPELRPEERPAFSAPKRRFLKIAPPPGLSPSSDAAAVQAAIKPLLEDRVLTAVGKRPLSLVIYIPPDFGPSRPAQVWTSGRPNSYLLAMVQGELTRVLRARALQQQGLDPAALQSIQAISAPLELSSTQRSTRERLALGSIAPMFISYMLIITLTITGQMALQGLIEERSNKLMESVLACITPDELMHGKLIGICGVGFTIILTWGAVAFAAFSAAPPEATEPVRAALASIKSPMLLAALPLYYVGGYLVLTMLFLAVGSLSESLQDAQAYLTPLMMILLVPYFLAMAALARDPDALMPVILSWIPLYTPFVMTARMGVGVGAAEVVGGLAVLAVFAYVEWRLLGRLFRRSVLRSGQPKLKEALSLITARGAEA